MIAIKPMLFFISAGLPEIDNCYLVWIRLKNDKPFCCGLAGLILLMICCFVPLLQNTNFGRVIAGYSGIFIVLSLMRSWKIDKIVPDRLDICRSAIRLMGIFVIMLPRR